MARFSVEHEVGSGGGVHEPSPNSSELRVSRDVKHESGIPPAREGRTRDMPSAEADQRLEQALSDVARTEANLQSLVRGLKHLTAGATAALDSTRPLASEIDAVRGLLPRAREPTKRDGCDAPRTGRGADESARTIEGGLAARAREVHRRRRFVPGRAVERPREPGPAARAAHGGARKGKRGTGSRRADSATRS